MEERLEKSLEVEVAIIGGGVVGTAVARELSKYKVEVALIEKNELSDGQTRGTLGLCYLGVLMLGSMLLKSGLAPGLPLYDSEQLRWKLLEKGWAMWFQKFLELDVDYMLVKNLLIATNKDELKQIEELHNRSLDVGPYYADHRFIEPDEVFQIEPAVTKNVIGGVVDEGKNIRAFPPEIVFALAENAQQNGVRIIENAEVLGITHNGGAQIIHTRRGDIKANFIINAAGRFADEVAKMGGYCDWGIYLVKGPMIIMDKNLPKINTVLHLPMTVGHLAVLSPTNEGNTLVDVAFYEKTLNKYDITTDFKTIDHALTEAHRIVPSITPKGVIRCFGGLRAFNDRDLEENIIEFPPNNPKFLNCAIRLPGMSQAPSVAEYVMDILGNAGLELVKKTDFNPYRKRIPRFSELSEFYKRQLIEKDPRYGHVVCRCETVTEGEICEAIRRGAHSVDSVRMRCRAGMGRCQGGFCGPRVVDILARELSITKEQVRQREEGTLVVPYKSKELLQKDW
jgi:glycerol-3-phosphate dehydrogenase